MRFSLLTLMLVALVLTGCAGNRDGACDVLNATGGISSKMQPEQTTTKWDALTAATIADSDGDAVTSLQRVAVDVQAPNQATGPIITIAPLVGDSKAAAEILMHVSPAELAIIDRIAANDVALSKIRERLANDPALTADERTALETKAIAYVDALDPLLDRLDGYAETKFNAAKALVPDLSALTDIVYQIVTTTNAGSTAPNISDPASTAIAKVAHAAVTTSTTADLITDDDADDAAEPEAADEEK